MQRPLALIFTLTSLVDFIVEVGRGEIQPFAEVSKCGPVRCRRGNEYFRRTGAESTNQCEFRFIGNGHVEEQGRQPEERTGVTLINRFRSEFEYARPICKPAVLEPLQVDVENGRQLRRLSA